MAVYMLFWGGSSYAPGSVHDSADVEVFPLVRDAHDAFTARRAGWDRQYPNVGADAVADVWLADPRAEANDGQAVEYPHARLFVGSRGATRYERV